MHWETHNRIQLLQNYKRSTQPAKKLPPLTTGFNCLRCGSAYEHNTAEQYSKTGKTKRRKHLTIEAIGYEILFWIFKCSRYQAFAKLFMKQNGDDSQRSSLTSNLTQNIKVCRLRTASPRVNWGERRCILRDLETIIVLAFISFNLNSRRSHHWLTLLKSWFRNSATATLSNRDDTNI